MKTVNSINSKAHQLALLNINNLVELWQSYGYQNRYVKSAYQLNINIAWPNRLWITKPTISYLNQLENTILSDRSLHIPKGSILPLWSTDLKAQDGTLRTKVFEDPEQESQHWVISFQQTAMVLSLTNTTYDLQALDSSLKMNQISISIITKDNDLIKWLAVCNKAFGYQVDPAAISHINDNNQATLILASINNTPVGCGLMFQTGNAMGVHQIGIDPEYQGRGIAKVLMKYIIVKSQQMAIEYIVLQASAAGKPLYKKLGFIEQFEIVNLMKN